MQKSAARSSLCFFAPVTRGVEAVEKLEIIKVFREK
jgi:hypothetical protein